MQNIDFKNFIRNHKIKQNNNEYYTIERFRTESKHAQNSVKPNEQQVDYILKLIIYSAYIIPPTLFGFLLSSFINNNYSNSITMDGIVSSVATISAILAALYCGKTSVNHQKYVYEKDLYNTNKKQSLCSILAIQKNFTYAHIY
ncbi:hypothetical protein N1030_07115 [Desulfovibrio mangrovi]|uniref:hypothetical protein n=1 Tax=Desulfovibrio mangrovi TaxID=2976983 RepID=UPI0022459FA0|nr:hypothetical protein [Desulfovibrio mangrovi]UZP68733.1 hypothetical protein N1030_07115 [Desulfovibrio mangrovi]